MRGHGPVGPGAAAPGPWLRRAGRRAFPESSALARDPELRVFMGDLVRPYGLSLREDVLAAGSGQTYGEMAEALIRSTVPADEPVDLLVLAFGIHDVRPGRSTATWLSHVCPGGPLAFAVCDQGSAAAFTGLRLVREYARGGGCRRALLVVAEQSTLHYPPAGPGRVPDRHAAVALLFESTVDSSADPAGTAELGPVRELPGIAAADVAGRLAEETAAVAAGREPVLVLGAGLAAALPALPGGLPVVVAPAGQPYTGPWWELAGRSAERAAEGRLVVVADWDPALRYLCLSTVDFAVSSARRPRLVGADRGRAS